MSGRALLMLTPLLAACAAPQVDGPGPATLMAEATTVPDKPFHEACDAWDEWDKPARPFQLMGNSWYVGTCGISAILITGEEGHILIDTGVEAAAPQVLANISALGFDPKDVRFILMSHEHFDHVAGHAALKAATGARVVASQSAAPVLESGLVAEVDPQAASGHPRMPPVDVDRVVADGAVLEFGNLELMAHATPGHTPGALSWTWTSCSLPNEPPVCRRMAYVDSLSAVSADGYRFTDHPEVVASFRSSIDTVRFLPCDLLVTPHPSSSQLIERLREGTLGTPGECARYAEGLTRRLEARLAKEAER